MNLITGKKSEDHITSAQFRRIIEALTGGGNSYCPTVRNGLTPTVSGNSISVAKGSIIHHGCVFECDAGSDDTVSFSPGTSGTNRIDLVCCKYTRNNSTGIENAVWEVLQGTTVSSSSTPVAPTIPSGDLRDADATQDYCAVFKLTFSETTVTCTAMLEEMPINGASSYDLLWTNTDTIDEEYEFEDQIIPCNVSGYRFFFIDFISFAGSQQRASYTINGDGSSQYIFFCCMIYESSSKPNAPSHNLRVVSKKSTGIDVGNNIEFNGTKTYANHRLIPYKIYGIK